MSHLLTAPHRWMLAAAGPDSGGIKVFQVVALAVLAPLALLSVHALIFGRRRRMIIPAAVLVAACFVTAAPALTQRGAELLGIGRGADLVAYLTTFAVIGCYFLVLYSHRRLRLQITELTRQLALAQLDSQRPRSGG